MHIMILRGRESTAAIRGGSVSAPGCQEHYDIAVSPGCREEEWPNAEQLDAVCHFHGLRRSPFRNRLLRGPEAKFRSPAKQ